MTDPADLRRSYERATLSEASIAATWLEQLMGWYTQAVELGGSPEPNAIQIATVDDSCRPSLRTVLAKAIDERGVTFYTNYRSQKGRELDAHPYAAMQFLWLAHERQVRLTGSVQRVSAEETAAYFHSRPRGSQLGAWASPQSTVIGSRAELEQAYRDAEARFGEAEVPVPDHWGGFLLTPDAVEFWQGRPDRLHDRLRFRRTGTEWVVERLAP